MKRLWIIGLVLLLVCGVWFVNRTISVDGHSVKFNSRCEYSKFTPDPECTPGDSSITDLSVICGNSSIDTSIDASISNKVLQSYGIRDKENFDVIYLIPASLGGTSDVKNLWPRAKELIFEKDFVDNKLLEYVCAGTVPLSAAQYTAANNWYGFSKGFII